MTSHTSTQAHHYLNLPDARTVITKAVRAAAQALDIATQQNGMLCLTADPGVGKTFTLHALLDQRPHLPALRLLARPQARPDDLRHSLHHALGLPGSPPKDPGICDDYLRHTLREPHRIVAIDEAHQLSATCIEYIRYLHDDPTPHLTLVLLASRPRLRALRSKSALASRVTTWHDMQPLTPTETLTAIPRLHQVWRHVPPETIRQLDDTWASGNLRRWAALTHRLLTHQRRNPHQPTTPATLLQPLQPTRAAAP
ncbi:AAA family ATPase [Streptomyces californicus]|uniref:AAA family ATPase n=1 Tax=Streptomyces californicus TaxID=67351 RepID=UPI0036784D79